MTMMSIEGSHNSMTNPSILPMGVRFRPTDHELIEFLVKFVTNQNFKCDDIRLEDLYGSERPWQIFQRTCILFPDDPERRKVQYFLTKLKKEKSENKRFTRKLTVGGSWKGRDCGKSVRKGATSIGTKRLYRYVEAGADDSIVWNMKEYSVDEDTLRVLRRRCLIQHEDVVLCCVKRKVVHGDDNEVPMALHSPSPLCQFTSVGHNAFPELQQGGNTEQVNVQDQNIEGMAAAVQYHTEEGTAVFHDSSPLYQFESVGYNVFPELQLDQINEHGINQMQNNIEVMMAPAAQYHDTEEGTAAFHGSSHLYQFESVGYNVFPELQQGGNIEQVNVQEQNIEGMAPAVQYHTEEGTAAFHGSSPLYQLSQQQQQQQQQMVTSPIMAQQTSAAMLLNQGDNSTNAADFVPDDDEQVNQTQNIAINSTEQAPPLAINSNKFCFVDKLLEKDDIISADLSWQSNFYD